METKGYKSERVDGVHKWAVYIWFERFSTVYAEASLLLRKNIYVTDLSIAYKALAGIAQYNMLEILSAHTLYMADSCAQLGPEAPDTSLLIAHRNHYLSHSSGWTCNRNTQPASHSIDDRIM